MTDNKVTIGARSVGGPNPVFVIAEISISHNGG